MGDQEYYFDEQDQQKHFVQGKYSIGSSLFLINFKGAYPVQRAPALCGVWGRVSVANLNLVCAMRGDHDSNPIPLVTGGKTLPLVSY